MVSSLQIGGFEMIKLEKTIQTSSAWDSISFWSPEWMNAEVFTPKLLCCFSSTLWFKVLVLQSCPTLFDPMDHSPSGSSVHEIVQARILEWVAIPFSRRSSLSRDWTCISCIAGGFFTIWATILWQLSTKNYLLNIFGLLLPASFRTFSSHHWLDPSAFKNQTHLQRSTKRASHSGWGIRSSHKVLESLPPGSHSWVCKTVRFQKMGRRRRWQNNISLYFYQVRVLKERAIPYYLYNLISKRTV